MKKEGDVTNEDLARMMAGGLTELRTDMEKGFSELRNDMDKGFSELRNDMDKGFTELRQEILTTNRHIDRIIIPDLDSHARRIKDLELKLA